MDVKNGGPRICVVSRDPNIASFFSLEAEACFCSATVLSEPPGSTEEYRLIILDDRAGYCFSETSQCQVITVSADVSKKPIRKASSPSQHWNWPVSIRTVRQTLLSLFGEWEESREEGEDRSEKRIYLFSDASCRVLYGNRVIPLTESEWLILRALGNGNGAPVSRSRLTELLSSEVGNAVDVHICHLRKKLEAPFGQRIIQTVRNQGYVLMAKTEEKAELS